MDRLAEGEGLAPNILSRNFARLRTCSHLKAANTDGDLRCADPSLKAIACSATTLAMPRDSLSTQARFPRNAMLGLFSLGSRCRSRSVAV